MSKYTVTLGQILQSGFDIGLQDYPIYNEAHRETLNTMIFNHYYLHEIGQETPGLFKLYLNNTMNEIMPKYNLMYKAVDEYYNRESLLGNVDITHTETLSGTNQQETSGSDVVKSYIDQQGKSMHLDTPQGQLALQDIDSTSGYATYIDMSEAKADGDTNKTVTEKGTTIDTTNTQTRTSRTVGNSGGKYPLEVLKDIIKSNTNIDYEIIKELEPLFFGLY